MTLFTEGVLIGSFSSYIYVEVKPMSCLYRAIILAGLSVLSGGAGLAASDAAHDEFDDRFSSEITGENLQQAMDFIPSSSEDVQLASVGAVLGGAFSSAAKIPKVLEWSSAVMLTAAAAAWGLWKVKQIQQGESLAAPAFYSGLKENFGMQGLMHKEHAYLLEHIQKQGPEEELKLLAWMEDQEEKEMNLYSQIQKVNPDAGVGHSAAAAVLDLGTKLIGEDGQKILNRYFSNFLSDMRVRQKIASGEALGEHLSWKSAIADDIAIQNYAVQSEKIKELLYDPLQIALAEFEAGHQKDFKLSKVTLADTKLKILKMIQSSGSSKNGDTVIPNSFSGPLPGVMRYLEKIAQLSVGKIYEMFPAAQKMSSAQREYVEALQKWYDTFGSLSQELDRAVDTAEMQRVMTYYIRLAQAKVEAAAGG